jgi:PEP-CTERM motif
MTSSFLRGQLVRPISRCVVLWVFWLAGPIHLAHADIVYFTVNANLNLATGPTSETLMVPQFNPGLGTLTGASVGIQYGSAVQFTMYNPYGYASSGTVEYGANTVVFGGATIGSVPGFFIEQGISTPLVPYAFGPSGSFTTDVFTDESSRSNGISGSALIGTGEVPVTASVSPNQNDTGPQGFGWTAGNLFGSDSGYLNVGSVDITVNVYYEFTPSTTPTPEPSSMVLASIGAMGAAMRYWTSRFASSKISALPKNSDTVISGIQ